MRTAKILYGAAFLVALPVLLVVWAQAAEPNVSLAAYGSKSFGYVLLICGAGLMFEAMRELWVFGGGLPMNAFPPPRLVSRGTFLWLPHPIYTGFIMICAGAFMIGKSAAGLWLVTPAIVFCCVALVLGYEHPDMKQRLGGTLHFLPADDESRPSHADRGRFYLLVVMPWLALYEVTIHMLARGTAFRFEFEDSWPVYPWTSLIYETTYLAVALAPWCARTRRDLRRLTVSAWVAMAVIFPFYWIVPSGAPRRPFNAAGFFGAILNFERTSYPPVAALPSFHVLWAILFARLLRVRLLGLLYVAVLAISCVTTGMHYVADIAAALLTAPLILEPGRAWKMLRAISEVVANSWREWRIGPVRIINHAAYAGLAAFVQMAIAESAASSVSKWKFAAIAFAGLLGAGAWAQWVEGSSRLRRPFGFYGGFLAIGAACLLFEERWLLLGGFTLGAPWMQAIGRLRCLVNGCCHGAVAPADCGIRVTDSHSRVARLAELAGVPIYPTQLYSLLGNIVLGLILLRLWRSGSPLALICGVYAIGNGCARFAEEAYRGEPQTRVFGGLRMYQWLAGGSVVLGAVVTCLRSPAAPALVETGNGLALALAVALFSAIAMGVDLPESSRRFARLT